MPDPDLRELLLLAYIDGLARRPALRPLSTPDRPVRLDDTGRAAVVPLPRPGGDRG